MIDTEQFHREYQTVKQDIGINGKPFQFLLPRTIDRFIDPDDPIKGFPLWAKIWPAATVLADYLDRLPVDPQRRILEIGSGIGLVGVVAAAAGHRVTITDYNRHALNFAAANAALNGCPDTRVVRLDWTRPEPAHPYDLIVGSEVIYKENDIEPLLSLFQRCLKPAGAIVLVEEMRQSLTHFFKRIQSTHLTRIRKKRLRSDQEVTRILLIEIHPKPQDATGAPVPPD